MRERRERIRSNRGATEVAQFPLTIYCMLLVVLLPVLNLVTLIIAGCTGYLAANDLAAKAATQPTFAQALNVMATEAYAFQSNTLAKFAKLSPQAGYVGCGSHLFVVATDIGGSGVVTSAADQSLNAPIDTTKSIYEMQVVSQYSVSPLVSLASFPLLGNVPGLGQPISLSFTASRPIEHPGGMQTSANGGNTVAVGSFNRVATVSPGTFPSASSGTWRTPNIYQLIQNAGQTIVSDNVLLVVGNNPNWTSAGVIVATGDKIWIDTQSVGVWNLWPGTLQSTDANGYGPAVSWINPEAFLMPSAQPGSLTGRVGAAGSMFTVGDTQLNYQLAGNGPFYLIINDYIQPNTQQYLDNTGEQMVRVIVTK